MVQNQTQYNGYFSCGFCLHPGSVVDSGAKNGRKLVRYTESYGDDERRTENSTLQDMKLAHKSKDPKFNSNGIKGLSVAVGFPKFRLVDGYCIDYMHSTLLGIVFKILDFWINS